MTADKATRTIERIDRLLANQQGALWRERDRALHAPIAVTQETAQVLLAEIDATMNAINTLVEGRIGEQQREAETREFAPGRAELMHFFKLQHDRNPSKTFQSYEVQVFSAEARHQNYDSLRSLVSDGYIEMVRSEEHAPSGAERNRLSGRGELYYRERVFSRLPESVRKMRLLDSADTR